MANIKSLSSCIALAAVVCLSTSASVSAAPITLTFGGTWQFHDPFDQEPTLWQAMSQFGVGQGTPLTYTMILNDAAQPDGFGAYLNAILAAQLDVGSLSLRCDLPGCSAATNGSLGGVTALSTTGELVVAPALVGYSSIGGGFIPSFLNFRSQTPVTSGLLSEALVDPGAWMAPRLMIGFRDGPNGPGGGGTFLGESAVRFVGKTAQVPEPGPLVPTALGFLFGALWIRRRMRVRGMRTTE